MSAGLAHELNNPSSAAQRIAVHLGEVIQTIQSVAHRLHHALEHEHWDRVIALVGEVLENLPATTPTLLSAFGPRISPPPMSELLLFVF
jgi:hypothetical protein